MTNRVLRHVARFATRIMSLLVLGLIAFAVSVLIVIPRATHGAALDVLTGSMTPGLPVGSIVLDRPVDPGTLHVGDIATYQKAPGKNEYITHRIIKIDTSTNPTTFTFKGDANRGPDTTPVPATAIRGKVWFHVPYLGAIRDAMRTKNGIEGVAMLLLAGFSLLQLSRWFRERRTRGEQPSNDGDGRTPTGDHSTITATISSRALDRPAEPAARLLLQSQLVEEGIGGYQISIDLAATEVDDNLEILHKMSATDVRIVRRNPTDASTRRLSLRNPLRSKFDHVIAGKSHA